MIKNVVFDIGNVILNFNLTDVLNKYTSNKKEQKFILKNIIHSPEWLGYGLIDTGYISRENAISIVQDRTNHTNDKLIENFWNTYNNYAKIDDRILDLIIKLKNKRLNIYLLSNINPYTHQFVEKSNLLNLVDGYVFSYQCNMVKPYIGIYNVLINKYSLLPEETLFIDDNQKNIDTGNKLGILSKKVEPDNYQSVVDVLKEMDLL